MEFSLPVVESFHSIQGEGAHNGRSAYFIRLASCKIGCPWCDTKISWSAEKHPKESILKLSKKTLTAQTEGASFVVITGGEPLHHNLDPLCNEIRKKQSIPIHLETSGVDNLSGKPNWITLSPKKHAPPTKEILQVCQELKIIIHETEDLIFAKKMAAKAKSLRSQGPLLFLQPGWNNKKGENLVFEFIKHNPEWRMSLQIHKWLNIS